MKVSYFCWLYLCVSCRDPRKTRRKSAHKIISVITGKSFFTTVIAFFNVNGYRILWRTYQLKVEQIREDWGKWFSYFWWSHIWNFYIVSCLEDDNVEISNFLLTWMSLDTFFFFRYKSLTFAFALTLSHSLCRFQLGIVSALFSTPRRCLLIFAYMKIACTCH